MARGCRGPTFEADLTAHAKRGRCLHRDDPFAAPVVLPVPALRVPGPVSVPRLRVDPVASDWIGMCAHVAPRLIGVDSWGFPVADSPLPKDRDLRNAEAAVASCPRKALFVDPGRPDQR